MSRNYRLFSVAAVLLALVAVAGITHKAKASVPVTVEEVENCALSERLTELDDLGYRIIAVTPSVAFDIQNREFCIECSAIPTCFINDGWQVWKYNVVYRE